MNTLEISLPPGFETLEPFVAQWARPTANARLRARLESDSVTRSGFFDAASPLIAQALSHLDTKRVDSLAPEDDRLMLLALAFAHVALAVEIQSDDESKHSIGASAFKITRAPADD